MSVIIIPLNIELYGSNVLFNEVNFRNNILTLINGIWSQAQIRFSLVPAVRLSDTEASRRLNNRNFYINTVGRERRYDAVQLQGIASGHPARGVRICIMQQWDFTETVNGVERAVNPGASGGTLAVALGAGNFGIRGLEWTIVARPAAVSSFLLAHELGHLLLGAGHGSRGNLMADSSGAVYNRLTEEQILLAHNTAERIPGRRH